MEQNCVTVNKKHRPQKMVRKRVPQMGPHKETFRGQRVPTKKIEVNLSNIETFTSFYVKELKSFW